MRSALFLFAAAAAAWPSVPVVYTVSTPDRGRALKAWLGAGAWCHVELPVTRPQDYSIRDTSVARVITRDSVDVLNSVRL